MEAKDLTELVSSVRPPLAIAGKAGRGPGMLESEVEEVTTRDADVASDDCGGVKPVICSAMFAPVAQGSQGVPLEPQPVLLFLTPLEQTVQTR